jgi:hypothetical protein
MPGHMLLPLPFAGLRRDRDQSELSKPERPTSTGDPERQMIGYPIRTDLNTVRIVSEKETF